MRAEIEVRVLELRRAHRYWGARRLALELVRKEVTPAPSESAVYRCLVRELREVLRKRAPTRA